MNKEEFIDFIKIKSEKEIYDNLLQGQDVHYFKSISENHLLFYDDFKRFMANNLNVHFNNIAIIGSAKTAFSLSPSKNFKEFDIENSDLDIVIVSDEYFKKFWKTYTLISRNNHIYNYQSLTSSIFRNFISVKERDNHYNNDELINWQKKINDFKTNLQLIYKIFTPINYRIYSSWEAVEEYHLKGLSDLKATL
jgi:hypothetical protein